MIPCEFDADALDVCEGEFSEPCVYLPAVGGSLSFPAVVSRGPSLGRASGIDPEFARGLANFATAQVAGPRLVGVEIRRGEDQFTDGQGEIRYVVQAVEELGVVTLHLSSDRRALASAFGGRGMTFERR